jgi:NOL1/NOP2/fmu family ribosome biogenesis protein
LKKDGVLIYSTCSYSKEEDEEIAEWLQTSLSIANCPLQIDSHWGIIESSGGYRFWPDKVKGEGFFIAAFKKMEGGSEANIKIKQKPTAVTKNEMAVIEKWINTANFQFIKHENTVYAWPVWLAEETAYLLNQLRVIYSGILVGELMRDKLVPAHALAMSNRVAAGIGKVELTREEAIRFLQRKDLQLPDASKGWQLASFEGHPLGWMNVLGNRINNYYPKELRILKEQ